jgi:hypothetical protein
MKKEKAATPLTGRFEGDGEYTSVHEKHKQDWSEKDRRLRKLRRHTDAGDAEESAETKVRFYRA